MEKQTVEKQRVNLYMPKYMVDELDSLAEELGANRTSLMNMVIRQYLDQRAVVKLTAMAQVMEKQGLLKE